MLECALLPARWQWEIMIDFNGPLAPIKIIVERFRSWIRGPLHVRRHWKTFGRISSIFQVSTYYNLTVKFALWMWYKWRKYKNHLYTHELGCAFWVIILFILRAPLLKYVMPTQKPRGFNKIRSISSSILCTKCVNTVKELLTRAQSCGRIWCLRKFTCAFVFFTCTKQATTLIFYYHFWELKSSLA